VHELKTPLPNFEQDKNVAEWEGLTKEEQDKRLADKPSDGQGDQNHQ
jgi:hypothetical protein